MPASIQTNALHAEIRAGTWTVSLKKNIKKKKKYNQVSKYKKKCQVDGWYALLANAALDAPPYREQPKKLKCV